MRKNSKLLLLGYLGFHSGQLDGQTVKTRDVLALVQDRYKGEVVFFDTQRLHYNPLSIVVLVWHLITCRVLLYLPAHNNLKYLSQPISWLSKLFPIRILYIMIGGWLPEFLQKNPSLISVVGSFSQIFAETSLVRGELEQMYGWNNIEVIPNFRLTESSEHSAPTQKGQLRIVFMGRIIQGKGIDWIKTLAEYIDDKYTRGQISIDFYGPIADVDSKFFHSLLEKFSCVSYGGILQPCDVPQTLAQYDLLVLPTHYYTEGFPGSILDAYIAGIPVVVTDWKHAREFVDDGSTGIIIPFDEGRLDLCNSIDYFFNNLDKLDQMKYAARKRGSCYTASVVWETLAPYLS